MNQKKMYISLELIRDYMTRNNIVNNLDTDQPINSLGIYKIDKTNSRNWIVSIKIPENSDSMYRNGYFKISIDFPLNFPQVKPKCRIVNKIYHLNISPTTGLICAPFLNQWVCSTTISELLVGLYLVFILDQNIEYPYSVEMAREYDGNYNEFLRKAKEWVIKYASPSSEDLDLVKKIFINKENKDKEINELKDKLNKTNKIIENQKKEIQNLTNQINSLKGLGDQITILKNEIKNKDEKINQLLLLLQNNNLNVPKKQIDLENMKCVTFITTDQSLFYGISCSGSDTFAEVEEKLYNEYPEYRETNNTFLANGIEILRFKTINDNKIGSGKPILLIKPS